MNLGNVGGMEQRYNLSDQIDEIQKDVVKKYNDNQKLVKKLENELVEQINAVKEALKTKIAMEHLSDLEDRMHSLIDKILHNINKRFMEKSETKLSMK